MKHLSDRLVSRPAALLVFGLAMIGTAALLRSTPVGIPFGVLAAGIGFAMVGLGAMLTIAKLAAIDLDERQTVQHLRTWMAEKLPHPPPAGHPAH